VKTADAFLRDVDRRWVAVDVYSDGAGGEDIPRFIRHLNRVERDVLQVPETDIELPAWLADRV